MNETPSRTDVYELVTNRIIAQMEKGIVPWEKPWTDAGLPQNFLNKTFYSGINVLLLSCLGYEVNCFLTFDQIKKVGGSVKKGEKGNIVVFWKLVEKEVEGETEPRKTQYLRYHPVFNISQCTGLPEKLLKERVPPERPNDPIAACEQIIAGMPLRPLIEHNEPEAYYHPAKDIVNMPRIHRFITAEAYYGTLFHELVHSTGHTSRLHREGVTEPTRYASENYSFEELVAEIGASYLQSVAGIHTVREMENRAAYLDGWLKAFKGDKKFIIYASSHAQKAADFILGTTPQKPAH